MQIEGKDLSFSYPVAAGEENKEVLKKISFAIEAGESVGLIGSNGVGKSTLLKLLSGIEYQYQGSVLLGGETLNKKNLTAIRKKTGFVFQDSENQLFMSTVYEDVAFAPQNYGLKKDEVEQRTREALARIHIEDLADQKIHRLSGGQKKLVSIASVLSYQPEILLMDEPSVALDPVNRRNLIRVLNELTLTKLIASHDLDFIYDTCERTILLHEGKIAADGKTKEILTDETLLQDHGLELPLSFSRR